MTVRGFLKVVRTGLVTLIVSSCGGGLTEARDSTPVVTPKVVAAVTLTPSTVQLKTAESQLISAEVRASDGSILTGTNIKWSSADVAVATVIDGVVTGIAPGTARITARVGEVEGSAAVSVAARPVASVALNTAPATVIIGGTVTYSAVARDDRGTELQGHSATWSSSSPAVATVSNTGVVQAIGLGSVNISATVGGHAALASLKVLPAPSTLSLRVISASPRAGELLEVVLPGGGVTAADIDGFLEELPIEVARTSDSTMAMFLPEIPSGQRTLRLRLNRGWAEVVVNVQTAPVISNPTQAINSRLDAVLQNTPVTAMAGYSSTEWTAHRRQLDSLTQVARQSAASLSPTEQLALARLLNSFTPIRPNSRIASASVVSPYNISPSCGQAWGQFAGNLIPAMQVVAGIAAAIALIALPGGQVLGGAALAALLLIASDVFAQVKSSFTTMVAECPLADVLVADASPLLRYGPTNNAAVVRSLVLPSSVVPTRRIPASTMVPSAATQAGTIALSRTAAVSIHISASERTLNSSNYTRLSGIASLIGQMQLLENAYNLLPATFRRVVGGLPPSIASISPGTATLRALNGAEVHIENVQPALVTLSVQPSSSGLLVSVTAAPNAGTPVSFDVVLNSDPTVRTVVSATIPAQVTVSKILLTPATATVMAGGVLQLYATAIDANGVPVTGATIGWTSSQSQIATVDANGLVSVASSAPAGSSVTISANSGSITASAAVSVQSAQKVAFVQVSLDANTVLEGQSVQATAILRAADNSLLNNKAVQWSVNNPSVAPISASTGAMQALAAGNVVVSALSDGVTGSATLTVVPKGAATITLTPPAAALSVNGTVQLSATVRDALNNPINANPVLWSSSDVTVATVVGGLVTAIKAGTVTIRASFGGLSATSVITVGSPVVASVQLAPNVATIDVNQQQQFTVTAYDAAGAIITGRPVTWSNLYSHIATLDQNGLLVAKAKGATYVSATIDGKTATSLVTVQAPVAFVSITPGSQSVYIGDVVSFTVTAYDANSNVITGRTVIWGSTNQTAGSFVNGRFIAQAIGSTTISATIEGIAARSTITVVPFTVATVAVTPATSTMAAGGTSSLTATAYDAAGRTGTVFPITWTSTNQRIAYAAPSTGNTTVIFGDTPGTVIFTATMGGKSGTAQVTVVGPLVASIKVTATGGSNLFKKKQTRQLIATAYDAAGAVVPGQIPTWSTSASGIASVSTTGLVTGIATGAATISAKIGNVQGAFPIAVFPDLSARYLSTISAKDLMSVDAGCQYWNQLSGTVEVVYDTVPDIEAQRSVTITINGISQRNVAYPANFPNCRDNQKSFSHTFTSTASTSGWNFDFDAGPMLGWSVTKVTGNATSAFQQVIGYFDFYPGYGGLRPKFMFIGNAQP